MLTRRSSEVVVLWISSTEAMLMLLQIVEISAAASYSSRGTTGKSSSTRNP